MRQKRQKVYEAILATGGGKGKSFTCGGVAKTVGVSGLRVYCCVIGLKRRGYAQDGWTTRGERKVNGYWLTADGLSYLDGQVGNHRVVIRLSRRR